MHHIRWWIAPVVFILIVAGFFYRSLTGRMLPVPADTLVGLYHPWRDLYSASNPRGVPFKNFLITDPVRQQIPWRKAVVDAWKRGERPGWNPYSFMGVPLDGNVQAAPYYPFNLLFFLFDFPTAWSVLIMSQLLLAGLFLFAYLSVVGVSPWGAIVGGLAWSFGGFSVSWLTWGTIMHSALWLPLMLLAVEKNKPLLLALAVIMTIFAGHMQIAVYTVGLAVLYLCWRKKCSKRYVFALILAGIITSVQWVPFLISVAYSGRVATEGWKQQGWFLPWQHLAQFVAPDYFGNPATMNYWGIWNYGEFVGYIGIIPLILVFSALRSSQTVRFFAWVSCISLFFMLPHPINSIRLPLQPTRLMVLVDFSLAVLAAFGFDAVKKKSVKGVWFVGGMLFLLWGIAYMKGLDVSMRNLMLPSVLFVSFVVWRYIGRLPVLLVLITVFDLFRFGWKFTPFTPREYFFPTTEIITFLKHQPKPFRIMSLDDRILPPNVSAYYGIESIEGYDPVAPKAYEDFLVASERGKADLSRPTGFNRIFTAKNIDSPLLRYADVRYVLTLGVLSRPFLREVFKEGETRVYEYIGMLPRAYLAERTDTAVSPSDALDKLFGERSAFIAVLNSRKPILPIPLQSDENVTIDSYEENTIRFRVNARNPRILVVGNAYNPRWKATVDGKKAKTFVANYLFTGLVVGAGRHDVILSYR